MGHKESGNFYRDKDGFYIYTNKGKKEEIKDFPLFVGHNNKWILGMRFCEKCFQSRLGLINCIFPNIEHSICFKCIFIGEGERTLSRSNKTRFKIGQQIGTLLYGIWRLRPWI